MNDFLDTGASGENEAAPEPHAAAASAHAHNQGYASTLATLRARIRALGPDAIAEISRSAQAPRGRVIEFCNGSDPFGIDKITQLFRAVSAAEAKHAGASTGDAENESEEREPAPQEARTDTTSRAPEAQKATSEAPGAATITVVTSINPAHPGKTFTLQPDGALTKTTRVDIIEATAVMIDAPNGQALLAVLEPMTRSTNQVLILDNFKNWALGQPFRIVTEKKLQYLRGLPPDVPVDDEGVTIVENKPVAARLKRGMAPSAWIMIDVDLEGMPVEWEALTIGERLEMFEPFLPGASTVERVECLSSSARVVKAGSKGGPFFATHAFLRISNPERKDELREYIRIAAVTAGMAFRSPRCSKKDGRVIGQEWRTVIDLAVILIGRVSIENAPDVSNAPGYKAIPAGAKIVNPGGGVLDISALKLPDAAALAAYKQKTGLSVSFSGAGGNLSAIVKGVLKLETEIEVKGVVKPLFEWLARMTVREKLRCEAPFRASMSEAAFIRKDGDADAIVYDSGTNTTYPLMGEFPDDLWIDAEPGRITRRFKSLAAFLAEYEPLRYVIDRLLAAAAVYLLTGKTGHAKTAFAVIAALAVVTGRQDLLGVEVSAGRVAYLSFENPDDVRMRFAVAAHRLNIDPAVIGDNLMVLRYHASPEEVAEELKGLSSPENGGPFSLVIVDTLQAAFDGSDFNQNKEVLDFVKRQRRLTGLPGKPCVLIAAHPIKNADKTSLVPYGGGSILNEADGNLTIWRADDVLELHWQGKWRGLDFDPKPFELELFTAPMIIDTKGRLVPIPVLLPLTAAASAAKKRGHADTRTALLQEMLANPDASQVGWAFGVVRSETTVSRTLKELATAGLVSEIDGKWAVTAKGRKHLADRAKQTDQTKTNGDESV